MSYFNDQYIRYCDDITKYGPDPDDDRFFETLTPITTRCPICNLINGEHTDQCMGLN